MSRTEHTAVVGAGPIGNGIAQAFATQGHEVIFFDPDSQHLANAVRKIKANQRFKAENGLVHFDDIDPTIKDIQLAKTIKKTITGGKVCHRSRVRQSETEYVVPEY